MFRTRSKYGLVLAFFGRPVLPFGLQFVVLAPLVLVDDTAAASGVYLFGLPWLLLVLGIVSLPFIGAAFRAFRLDDATRRNHALEHATIYYLLRKGARRLSGEADRDGFRITGNVAIPEIRSAFYQVRQVIRDRGRLPYISRRCGSNVVTALGLGLFLLLMVALAATIFRPPLALRALALAAVVLLFSAMRSRFGDAMQRRFFMRVDFDSVDLRQIRRVRSDRMESGPVHFVETIVHTRVHGIREQPVPTARCQDH